MDIHWTGKTEFAFCENAMRHYIATVIAAGSLVCTAHADQNLDKYRKCWVDSSTAVINASVISGRTLSYAVFIADSQCRPVKVEAMATNSVTVVNRVSEQLVAKFHSANWPKDTILPGVAPVDVASTPPKQD
jgi:hypothetical protein